MLMQFEMVALHLLNCGLMKTFGIDYDRSQRSVKSRKLEIHHLIAIFERITLIGFVVTDAMSEIKCSYFIVKSYSR